MTPGDGIRVEVATDVHCRWFHEELVVLDIRNGEYFALDELGGRIWQVLAGGLSVGEAIEELVPDYDVAPSRLREGVQALVGELIARGLMVRRGRD